jgi:hypothetical protein
MLAAADALVLLLCAGPDSWKVDPSYLTVEQAMADYIVREGCTQAGRELAGSKYTK